MVTDAAVLTPVVDRFVDTARSARSMIANAAVADRWDEPSALEEYTVGALAGHLARAVLSVGEHLDADPAGDGPALDAAGYFVQVLAEHDPIDSPLHLQIRARAEELAAAGHAALVARLDDEIDRLAQALTGSVARRRLTVRDGIVLSVDTYLETRLVELVVHLDDLAVSVGDDDLGDVPDEVMEPVVAVLAVLASRRRSGRAVMRSLARRERHTTAVRAL